MGGKLDVEAQLLTEMYTQLLQNGGYNVNEKLALGNNSIIVHKAITSAVIDLYTGVHRDWTEHPRDQVLV